MNKPLLSPDAAAAELCISTKQLRSLTCAGQIRYVNIGLGAKRETRRYDPEDIMAFREARKCQSIRRQDGQSTAMTSVIEGKDFQALRAARQSAMRNGLKTPNGRG